MYEGPENHKKTEGQGQLGIEHTATPDTDELNKIEVLSEAADSPEGLQGLLTKADREELGDKVHTLYRERNTQDSAQHESGFNWKAKAAVGASALVMGGLIYGAVTLNSGPKAGEQNNNLPPAPEPTAEAPVVPGESAAPTAQPTTPVEVSPTDIPTNVAEPTPIETEKGSEYSVSELKEMPLEEFNKLPLDSRLVLVADMLEYANDLGISEFGYSWKGDTSELYNYNPLDIASKDNTAEEIAMQDLYMHQLALTQTKDLNTSGTFDPDMAAKALSGAYINQQFPKTGDDSTVPENSLNLYNDTVQNFNQMDTTVTAEYTQALKSAEFVSKNTITDKQGVERPIVEVEYVTEPLPEQIGVYPEGSTLTAKKRFVYHTFNDKGIWLSYGGVVYPGK